MPIVENRYFKAASNSIGVTYQMSGENILDNWHFANPVNQRGETSYTGTGGLTIDRWTCSTSSVSLYIEPANDRISVMFLSDGTTYHYFLQRLEFADWMVGKTFTMSVEYVTTSNDVQIAFYDGSTAVSDEHFLGLATIPATANQVDYEIFTSTFEVPVDHIFQNKPHFHLRSASTEAVIRIKSIKLELGNISTLAVSAAPRYSEQLAICQRYLYITAPSTTVQYLATMLVANTNGLCYGVIPFHTTMATAIAPTPSIIGNIGDLNLYGNFAGAYSFRPVSAFNLSGTSIDSASINATANLSVTPGVTIVGSTMLLLAQPSVRLQFSAEI